MYGKELILDLYECDKRNFTRASINKYLEELCKLISMKRAVLHFWDYDGEAEEDIPYDKPHLVGRSAVQFITTSNITIHTLEMLDEVYINIFSCKDFNSVTATNFTVAWFKAKNRSAKVIVRGENSECKER